MLKKGCIYKHIFPNGKCYVGKTVTSIKDRVGSNFVRYKKQSLLWRAIVKYGVDSIVTEVLYEAPVECLNTLEKLAICQNGSHKTRNGYNMTWGGDGIGSDDARASVLRQLEQGTHVFLDASFREKSKKINAEMGRRRFKEGVHPFQRPLVREKRRNNLRESTQKRLENGTHHFLSGEIQKKVPEDYCLKVSIYFRMRFLEKNKTVWLVKVLVDVFRMERIIFFPMGFILGVRGNVG